ncbi:hypothetical protein ACHAW6_000188 [Cyclotella cf. meneghiniana]
MSVGKTADDGTVSIFTKDGVMVHKETNVLITFHEVHSQHLRGAKSRISIPSLTAYETLYSLTRWANSHCARNRATSRSWLWWKSTVAPYWLSPSKTVPTPNSPALTPH